MWLHRLYRGWRGRATTGREVKRTAPRRQQRFTTERLEERALLANFTSLDAADLIADIDAANQTAEADTIELVAGATYTLTEVNNTTNGATGLPSIAAGEDLTIVGNGSTIERSTAAGTPAFRLFEVAAGAALTLKDLTLQGGSATEVGVSRGGGILNQGTLTLNRVTVRNNSALGNSRFLPRIGEHAAGGGIYSSGSLTLESSIIQNNEVRGGSGTAGGNAFGGGLYVSGSPAAMSNVTLVGNTALGGSGGAYGSRGSGLSGGPGGVGFGGGLYVQGSTIDLTDISIASNTARGGPGGTVFCGRGGCATRGRGGDGGSGFGGGTYVAGGSVSLRDSSVTGNAALGGSPGSGRTAGRRGQGIGGGLNVETDALVCLDASTESNVKRNLASARGRNIAGPFATC
jgi:hypothetical protein